MSKQTAISLPDDIHTRLQSLAAKTGKTASFYIQEAIEEHLDDLEDLYLAENAMNRIKRGESEIVSAEDFWHGLDD
jgi:RHH-type transcriptional regulator, rel operon repressor / antitoxin RelB